MTRNAFFMLFSILLILLGYGALFHQYLFANGKFFTLSDVRHHEVIAIILWCLGFGILIGLSIKKCD